MGRLDNQVALVTGAARGIGAAVARLLADEGSRVAVADVLDDEGASVASAIGERARYLHLDVTEEESWSTALKNVEDSFGPVSVLVNNAGVVEWGSIEEQSLASFRRVIDINLQGPWLGMHTLAPSLRRAGGGVIVNVSSTAGLMGYSEIGGYVASKWGLRGLTKAAALELAGDGVRVCSVHPGPIRTPMTADMDESFAAGQPIPRFGEPEEVARMVLFVVADATYSTGVEFVLDGGSTVGSTALTPQEE
ncbi:SDR family oxidoreductase [Streptomyces sp. NPDC058877]|uniref:SDR family oxidoreductase n=1 Tax=unclassified Streptomyces TaxID=2593676 RepID=UPI0036790923